MKKFFLYTLVGAFLLTSCTSGNKTDSNNASTTEAKQETVAKPIPPKSEGPIRVLFVGNSHTEYFASFPLMLEALAKENGKQVEVATLIEMGVSIDKILSANKAKANKLFAETDQDGNYFDYVILQESTPVAAQDEKQYIADCKSIHDLIIKNSPDVAAYIYELMFPIDYEDSDYDDYQKVLSDNAVKVAKALTNTGILKFATALGAAYQGKEGYSAEKEGKDVLRHTDSSRHMLNDAVFLNSIVLYQTLFGETPKIPQQLPLATGTGDRDEIALMDVAKGISNPQALEKIAASYK
ncbi:hypothetical protein [Dysgonomonas macrotermitis]|uniref:Lipoprotein n=1 Tax=Dysgonomonas macrotermitis TaxID=1346286 RepID=A0A1M4YS37_9BACT|nr:hypothetical protein [Dysgonomonas macrotermitis]SHF08605.1 hypothetical protein SAMN05444362_103254 [Dysgonomonas macrotermitis]